jgi:hypothetical protein
MNSSRFILVLMLVLMAGCGAPDAAVAPLNAPVAFSQDFRKNPELPKGFRPHSVLRDDMLQATPEGLAMSVPKAVPIDHRTSVGVESNFGLTGDFEITGTFEVVKIVEPTSSYGVGVGIYIAVPGWEPGANLSRVVRDGVDQGILCNSWGPGGSDDFIRCSDNVLRLRYRRSGGLLTYWWTPGAEGGDFKKIHQFDFGVSDVANIRIGTFTAGSNCDLSARMLDLQIRGEITNNPVPRVENKALVNPPKSRRLVFVLIGLSVFLVLAMGVWLFRRFGRRAKAPAG